MVRSASAMEQAFRRLEYCCIEAGRHEQISRLLIQRFSGFCERNPLVETPISALKDGTSPILSYRKRNNTENSQKSFTGSLTEIKIGVIVHIEQRREDG